MPVLIGTSGWQYPHWDGKFYPADLAKSSQLAWYAARFRIVEVNLTFYRLPEATVFRSWAEQTPADFVMDVKASRLCLHPKGLEWIPATDPRVSHYLPRPGDEWKLTITYKNDSADDT
ncbi:MAG TPA: DUF72 domain-containing protein [Thermoanaerobaculia bacterium]|nr:DUF72 domain-containing protein [Thermoanaerobaculia bacterium]